MTKSTTTTRIPLIARAESNHAGRVALVDADVSYTYDQLLDRSAKVAAALLDGKGDLNEARVAFIAPPGVDYVAVQWGIWRAGGIAVPLCTMHPASEMAYVIQDADASIVVAHASYKETLEPIAKEQGKRFYDTQSLQQGELAALPNIASDRPAMLIYTSGTTNMPKGVLTTHDIIAAQISDLIEAWEWTAADRIPLVLPLHHVHGVVNVLGCALWAGATCEMLSVSDAPAIWKRLLQGGLTLFMAVPTIYVRLAKVWEAASPEEQKAMTDACKKLRVMVCGSAALPVSTLEHWRNISGHTLLERYGMTEIGMGLSNPLHGERMPGHVGSPLPGVQAQLMGEDGQLVEDGQPGEIQIRGKNVFREYWQRPEATAASFQNGWFKTGDVAIRENGIYRILGRNSVDIIKTGGFKVSALEIESHLLTHEAVDECAVVGIEDPEWGERVSAAVVCKQGKSLELKALREWAKAEMAVYKVPSQLLVLEQLPRNAMGKIVKPEVIKLFAAKV